MQKLFMVVILLSLAAPAIAADDIKISGAVEIQYRSSDDYYNDSAPAEYTTVSDSGDKGGDVIQPEELYVQVSKKFDKGLEVFLKVDGADMDRNAGASNAVEEAKIIFSDLGLRGLSIVAGKDEMPFGQDYEKFFLSSITHGLEIDKVWGLHGMYSFKGLGTIAAAVFERDRAADTRVQDSFAARATMDKLVKNLSVEVSAARIGKNVGAAPAEKDQSRLSGGAVYKWNAITVHAEKTIVLDYNNVKDYDMEVTQVGADFKFKKFLFKVRQEIIDYDNRPVAIADNEELKIAGGANYYFSDKTYVTAELEHTTWDVADDSEEVLLGLKFIF